MERSLWTTQLIRKDCFVVPPRNDVSKTYNRDDGGGFAATIIPPQPSEARHCEGGGTTTEANSVSVPRY